MRKKGASLRDVVRELGVPGSTLSGWFKNVNLSSYRREVLRDGLTGLLFMPAKPQ